MKKRRSVDLMEDEGKYRRQRKGGNIVDREENKEEVRTVMAVSLN